jgi:hypothetical protein
MIVSTHSLTELEHKDAPMPHHKAGLSWTRSGYGSRIPTAHMVKLPGGKRWRRVYCCIWSNSGTCYVDVPGGWAVIRD